MLVMKTSRQGKRPKEKQDVGTEKQDESPRHSCDALPLGQIHNSWHKDNVFDYTNMGITKDCSKTKRGKLYASIKVLHMKYVFF